MSYYKTEIIKIYVEYEISYRNKKSRKDAIESVLTLPFNVSGFGPNGVYGNKRLKDSVKIIPEVTEE